MVATAVRHFRFALRSFRHHGGTHALAIAILALGIGLSVAMFSLVHAVILNPLPFSQQDRIFLISKRDTQTNEHLVGELAYPELADLRATIPDIEHAALIPAALYGNGRVLQVGSRDPVQIETCPTSSGLFRALGVTPLLGRDFTAADEGPQAAPVVILSGRIWREQFAGARDVMGRLIRLNGAGHTVIGVMDADVDFPRGAGLWVPLRPDTLRARTWLQAVARVRVGVTRETLLRAVERTFQIQIADHLKEYSLTQRAAVTPISEYLTGSSKAQLWLALFASLLLLLSASASASNLFLSRVLARRREVATRISLGASTSNILSLFAIEGLLAASLATLSGALLAAAAIRVLIHWAPADIPRIETAKLDLTAMSFAAAVALVAAVACTIGPALLLRRKNLESLLREGGIRSAGSRAGGRMRSIFIFSQAALTVAILTVGLLLFVSYRTIARTETGFAHRDTLTMNLAVLGRESPELRDSFYTGLLERLRAKPEVISAAAVLLRPLEGPIGWDTEYTFEFEEGHRDPNKLTKANFEVVTPKYFATVGTSILSGRDFNEYDSKGSEKVIVISRSLAQRIRGSGRDAIGQRVRVYGEWRKVVGVTADARYRRVVESGDDIYLPYLQIDVPTNYLVLRGHIPAGELASLVRKTLKEIDPLQAIAGEATLGELMERNTARDRFNASIMILFALGAIMLAAAGIHSVIRESIAVRRKEIAVRIAVGAGRGRLVLQTTRSTLLWVIYGELAGMLAATLLGQSASGLLYGVSPRDPLILATVFAFVLSVAATAAFIPAWASAGRDPREYLLGE